MKDGFKIADVDTHLMEPDYVFERYIDDRYKSAAPKMGIAAESGRRTFLVEGEPFTREKGKYPMAAPRLLSARRWADAGPRVSRPPAARRMLRRLQRLERRLLLKNARPREVGRDFAHAGRGRIDQGGQSRGEERRHQLLRAAQPGSRANDLPRRLPAALGGSRKTRTPDFHPRF